MYLKISICANRYNKFVRSVHELRGNEKKKWDYALKKWELRLQIVTKLKLKNQKETKTKNHKQTKRKSKPKIRNKPKRKSKPNQKQNQIRNKTKSETKPKLKSKNKNQKQNKKITGISFIQRQDLKFKRGSEHLRTVPVEDLVFNLFADFLIIFWLRVVLAHSLFDFSVHLIKSFLVETVRILHSKHINHTLELT